ncbi:MAG: ferrous iron transport protein A [Bacilli bacterium]|nr:ferrous iron transport protein A [Bacilli bacterium]
MLKTLDQFKIGETGRVEKVTGEGRLRRRLFDMGVTPGATIYLRKKAPLGDPLEVTIRGYELTLRKSEAELVLLELEETK